MSAHSPKKEMAVLGPFYIADYKSGSYILLNRNPNYWKHDSTGHTLPYLGSVKLDIQSNRSEYCSGVNLPQSSSRRRFKASVAWLVSRVFC